MHFLEALVKAVDVQFFLLNVFERLSLYFTFRMSYLKTFHEPLIFSTSCFLDATKSNKRSRFWLLLFPLTHKFLVWTTLIKLFRVTPEMLDRFKYIFGKRQIINGETHGSYQYFMVNKCFINQVTIAYFVNQRKMDTREGYLFTSSKWIHQAQEMKEQFQWPNKKLKIVGYNLLNDVQRLYKSWWTRDLHGPG